MVNASKSPEEIRERLDKICNRLEGIKKDQDKKIKDLRQTFGEQVDSVVQLLSQYLLSDDIKERFTKWSKEDAPDEDGGSCKNVKENVNAALSRRFQEIVDQWEEENKVFSDTRTFLMGLFQNHFDDVEFKLQNVQSEATGDDSNNPRKLTFRIHIPLWKKACFNVINFAWFVMKGSNSIRMLSNAVKILYKRLLNDASEGILAVSLKQTIVPFVEDKLRDIKLYLDRIDSRLQELIEADRQLYEQLTERPARYQPVFYEVKQHRNQLAKFGLTEVCAVKIDGKELEWKEETASCLGRGAFGAVYQGTMKRDGEVKDVALKVWNEALDASNAKEIMEEIKNLR